MGKEWTAVGYFLGWRSGAHYLAIFFVYFTVRSTLLGTMLLDISFLRIVIYILMCLSWLSLLPFANGNTSLGATSLWIFITFFARILILA